MVPRTINEIVVIVNLKEWMSIPYGFEFWSSIILSVIIWWMGHFHLGPLSNGCPLIISEGSIRR